MVTPGPLVDDDDVAPQVKALMLVADAQGWTLKTRREPRGFRYWCPCDRQHQTWIVSNPKFVDAYVAKLLELLRTTTCWKDETS